MDDKIETRGGQRPNSGRKPVKDKAIQLTIYPRKSDIKKAGGIQAAKRKALAAICRPE